jgi:hypothetical protein
MLDVQCEKRGERRGGRTMTMEGAVAGVDELVDRLHRGADRLTVADLDALLQSREELLPALIQIVSQEDYWYEGQGSGYWVPFHAVTLLSLSRDPRVVDDLIAAILPSYFADYDWLHGHWPVLLAQLGPAALDPLMEWIGQLRGGWEDNPDYSEARIEAATALALIAHAHPEERGRVLRFYEASLLDREENDRVFLGAIVPLPLLLDWSAGLLVVEAAYKAKRFLPSLAGSLRDLTEYRGARARADFFRRELLWFYDPLEIARRGAIWADPAVHDRIDALREKGDPRIGSAPVPPPMSYFYPESPPQVDLHDAVSARETAGRNDPCPCRSGKKYKKCCGAN